MVIRAHRHILTAAAVEFLRAELVQHPAFVDNPEIVRHFRQLVQDVAGDHNGDPLLIPQLQQRLADLGDLLGIQAVDRLIQDQDLRIPHQRQADAEPLPHAQRIGARGLLHVRVLQADNLQQFLYIAPGVDSHTDTLDLQVFIGAQPGIQTRILNKYPPRF